MKATMESTSKLLILNGLNFRVWEGVTENGIRFVALVNRLQAANPAEMNSFVAELGKAARNPVADTEAALIAMGVVPPPAPPAEEAAKA
jgi:hypothetical protein